MVVPVLILILSTAFFFFYLQSTCQHILHHQFEREYFRSIVNANLLEFSAVRETLGDADAPGDCSRVQMKLKCDYLALTYLLKNAANVTQRYSLQERLLMVYFRVVFASLITRHWFRLRQEPAIMRLTVILQYFANLVGQRVSTLRFAEVTETN